MKHLHTVVTLCMLFGVMHSHAQVVINELQASNSTSISDPDNGEFNDWLELYNPGNSAISLSGWRLSDNDNSAEWFIPAGTTIAAKGFLLIWADGSGTGLHTSFSLSADGEQLSLYNAAGSKVDDIVFPAQLTDVSMGRQTDGGAPWGYFSKGTPGTSNNAGIFYTDYVRQEPVFSQAGGFFTGAVTLSIIDKYDAGTLRYTLDGSVPAENSAVFGQPIQINTTTVVKARMFYPGQLPGPVVTNTYFINEDFEQRGLAVLSLSTNPDYFFAPDSGLYVQDFKPTWEYPVHLEFYEPDGLLGFHHDAGVQVGGENAWILPQKLLNIYSRSQYGSGHFDYQLFPDNPRSRFGDIILRCSGSDWSYTMFRDGLMQGLIDQEADLDDQDFRPCAVYINGQYFGIHNIREKQDAEYTEYYHGIDPDSLDYIENNAEIKEGDDVAYQQMVAMLNAGLQNDAAFQAFDAIADTEDFTDYIISQIFVANTSWGHNIALFRKRTPSARWRWLLHDYDRGFNLGNVNGTAMDWATATDGPEYSNAPWATLFLRKMLENNAFRERFITRFADHLYITYNPVTINRRVDFHANWIRPEMPGQVARWLGTTSSYGDAIPSVSFWENEVANLKQFGVQRNTFMHDDLSSFFGLAGSSTLNLEVSNAAHGSIRLHEMQVPSYPWTGKYFQNRPFTLTAEAKPGFNFVHWEKTIGTKSTLLSSGSTWKYSDANTAPQAGWYSPTFNDAAWQSGPAQLGYGDGDEATTLSFGGNTNNKTPSYYFRTTIDIADPASISGLLIRLKADDGAVVYLNGNEIWRVNMPAAPAVISFGTLALSSVSGSSENAWNELTAPAAALLAGQNTIAVEIHQADVTSSDVSFDLELQGTIDGVPEIIGTDPVLEVTLDANPRTLRAVFESDGTCGILPDTILQDQVLTTACSLYIAAGDVVVKPNVTLTVEPGVDTVSGKCQSMGPR
ncbi:MAG: CotH kinase family protein [Saprospiraceae bacterium]|nr:CotH kinase family protein [Candidatus Opimibacter iunctus]